MFVIALRDGYPINVLGRIREIPEVCSIFCATANPVEVIVAETEQGRGVLGVIDGSSPKGVEDAAGVEWRHGFLRKIGYKRWHETLDRKLAWHELHCSPAGSTRASSSRRL